MDEISHHYIHGTCSDYVTGESLVDTDDERYRQKLARYLVEEKGYAKDELEPRLKIETLFAGQFVTSIIDLVVRVGGKRVMIVRYGPGSLVTRERPAVAAARVLDEADQIPFAVVTNGEDAEVLDSSTGKVRGVGLAAIPDRHDLERFAAGHKFLARPVGKALEAELRILNAFDVEKCCVGGPCALPGAEEG